MLLAVSDIDNYNSKQFTWKGFLYTTWKLSNNVRVSSLKVLTAARWLAPRATPVAAGKEEVITIRCTSNNRCRVITYQ